MAKTDLPMKACRCHLPLDLYKEFTFKIRTEGWTIQEALHKLILRYVREKDK